MYRDSDKSTASTGNAGGSDLDAHPKRLGGLVGRVLGTTYGIQYE